VEGAAPTAPQLSPTLSPCAPSTALPLLPCLPPPPPPPPPNPPHAPTHARSSSCSSGAASCALGNRSSCSSLLPPLAGCVSEMAPHSVSSASELLANTGPDLRSWSAPSKSSLGGWVGLCVSGCMCVCFIVGVGRREWGSRVQVKLEAKGQRNKRGQLWKAVTKSAN